MYAIRSYYGRAAGARVSGASVRPGTAPVMTDMCGNALTPVMTQNADPVCVGDKIYTFTYTDCAGNTAAWTYTFSINDNIAPTGTAPANISITNVDPVPAPDPTLITDEADNCAAEPTVTFISAVSDNGTCPEIITRTSYHFV